MIPCEGYFHALPPSLDFSWWERGDEDGASLLWAVLLDKEETVVDVTLHSDAVLVPPPLLILGNSKDEPRGCFLLKLMSSEMCALTGLAACLHPPFSFRRALTGLLLQFFCAGLLAGTALWLKPAVLVLHGVHMNFKRSQHSDSLQEVPSSYTVFL